MVAKKSVIDLKYPQVSPPILALINSRDSFPKSNTAVMVTKKFQYPPACFVLTNYNIDRNKHACIQCIFGNIIIMDYQRT